jgi:hypothetical protein
MQRRRQPVPMNVLRNRAAILLFLINKYKLIGVKGRMQDFANEAVAAF